MDNLLWRIDINSKAKPGKPTIRGMRITVNDIMEYLGNGGSQEELLQDFPFLEEDDVRAAHQWVAGIEKRNEKITLYKKYSPKEYPKYDNYNAINVDKVADIPMDYEGVMGVPISFMDKYNPEQFEIIGFDYGVNQGLHPALIMPKWEGKLDRGYVNGHRMYSRILIRNRKPQK